MEKEFKERLTRFLDHELRDLSTLYYDLEWCPDSELCYVEIEDRIQNLSVTLSFNINDNDDLILEMDGYIEGWKVIREYQDSVRYLWMMLAPLLV